MNTDADKPARILVIDDDPMAVELLETRLTDQGYRVTAAYSAEEGIAAEKRIRHHLILLDVMMPDMSGFEACRMLNAIQKDRYVPIILLTSIDDVDSKVKGLECGAYDYITKPFDSQELLARAQAAIRTKRLYDELKATRERLTEAERLAALGEMAITLNHEINNPLQAILLAAENMMSDLASRSISKEDIETVLANCGRIDQVLKQITNLKRIRSEPYVGGLDMLNLDESVRG
jgi:DNA-binding response OmpR family regulator